LFEQGRQKRVTAFAGRCVVLVTGMSGTGKSTALAELARRGHRVVDTDDPGWIVHVETPTALDRVWDVDRVGALLDGHHAGWLFVSGCVANQGVLYDRFDAVVLLSAPVEILLARVLDRASPFGSQPEQRARIANDVAAFEPLLRAAPTTRSSRRHRSEKSSRRWSMWRLRRTDEPAEDPSNGSLGSRGGRNAE